MKKILALAFCFLTANAFSQKYDTIEVGLMTTVHLIFDHPVITYDLGSGTRQEDGREVSDVIIVKEQPRIKLAAAIEHFETTNLFIETENAYYNFILRYREKPKKLTHYISVADADHVKAIEVSKIESNGIDQEIEKRKDEKILSLTLQDLAKEVWEKPNLNPEVGQDKERMKVFLNGVYSKGDYLFFRVNMINDGNIKYDLGYEGFFIKDKKSQTRKSPSQTDSPDHILTYNNEIKTIKKGEEISKVYVFSKFTIGKKKAFVIDIEEEKGLRSFELKITSEILLSAKTL